MIKFNDPICGRVLAAAAKTFYNPEGDTNIARVDEHGIVLGGMIYTGYTGVSISMHVASFTPRWGNRDMLWAGFDYPFRQLGVERIFGQIPETNSKALEFDLKLGFKLVAKIDDVFPDGGMLVVRMDRADCKWLNMKPRNLISGVHDGRQEFTTTSS